MLKIKIVVHEAEEGDHWAEVPAIPGCATQGDSMDELMRNIHEAIEGWLSIEVAGRHRTDAGIAWVKSISGRNFARIFEGRGWTLLASVAASMASVEAWYAYRSDPRQEAVEDGPATSFGEAGRTLRRRPLATQILALFR